MHLIRVNRHLFEQFCFKNLMKNYLKTLKFCDLLIMKNILTKYKTVTLETFWKIRVNDAVFQLKLSLKN